MLGIVTCHYNPLRYQRNIENYHRFRGALNQPLVTVELSFNEQFEIPDAIHITGDERHILWQKERLLNLAIDSLPADVDKVAWLDADLLFLNPDCFMQAERLLDDFPVVQLASAFHHTDAAGHICQKFQTYAYAYQHGAERGVIYNHGGGWAARRELVGGGQLFDRDIIGGGDTSHLHAWSGTSWKYSERWNALPAMKAAYLSWAEQQYAQVQGKLTYVPGEAVHLWHGERVNRQYWERRKILLNNHFDPAQDIRLGENGAWEWASAKPELHRAVQAYFAQRREDG